MGEKINAAESYIRLNRKILRWEWYKDSSVKSVFIHLLLIANYEDRRELGEVTKRGQVRLVVSNMSEVLGMSESTIRRCVKRLVETGEIKVNTNHHNTLVTIVNYDRYQGLPRPEPPPKKEKPKPEETTPEFERWANQ